MTAPSTAKLGIVAGSGILPGLLIAACRREKRAYFVLGLQGFANPVLLLQEPDAWIRLGEAGRGFELMRAAGVGEIVMAGGVRRPSLADLKPDLKTAAFFARIAGKVLGDDGLLSAVVAEIERDGFKVVGADQILTSLLAPAGPFGSIQPDDAAMADIAKGIQAAHDLGRRDLGQAVVVQNERVLGVEDVEGTDALLQRCAALAQPGRGGVLVKMLKPQQERRVDLPTIGVTTVKNAARSGLRGIAVEAGHTLVIDRAGVAAAADAAGLFVVGISSEERRVAAARAPLVYIVAAEPSGDQLGAMLIKALREETGGALRMAGVGGPAMTEAGLQSLFDPADLALLGIFEVIPKAAMVLRRVRETVDDIEARLPDVLVTIDSWGFTGRIHERLEKRRSRITRVRYAAPQVWAWRPGRARQLARWIHHLMTLLPFEPAYFTGHGLPATWVGHPVLECGADKGDAARFRREHGIAANDMVLCVLPGSRKSEIGRLLGVFGETVRRLAARVPRLRVVIPTVPNVEAKVRAGVAGWPGAPVVVSGTQARWDAFAASRAALAASGTVSLELALAGVPHVIAYRVNPLSALVVRWLIRTRFANLVNVLLDRAAIPERLQGDCRAEVLMRDVLRLMADDDLRARMQADFKDALSKLSPGEVPPSRMAARTVLSLMKAH